MYRRMLCGWLLVLFFSFAIMGQGLFPDPFQFPDQSAVGGGIGVTWIDNQPYTTLTISPDIAIGKFGLGIYLQLLFDNQNNLKLREDEYKGGAGILRAIRYVRYGQKYEPVYFRVGMLDRATLGNGFLVWNYHNGTNYDKRKVGLVADVDMGKFGVETLWSSVGTSRLHGGSVYVRPFRLGNTSVPILKRFRIHATYVRDKDVPAGPVLDSTATLSAFGVGADLRWLDLPVIKSAIYADYARFTDYGSGKVVGVNLILPEFIGLFGLAARYEKRFNGEQFIPSLFGPLYELQRELGIFNQLQAAEKSEGYFGELSGHVIHKILLRGNYQRLNGVQSSGILHLEASAPDLIPQIELLAYYDKVGIETFEDVRTLDNRSVLTAEASYQINRFLLLTMVYRWYWREIPEGSGIFKPVERIEPRISFRYNFQ